MSGTKTSPKLIAKPQHAETLPSGVLAQITEILTLMEQMHFYTTHRPQPLLDLLSLHLDGISRRPLIFPASQVSRMFHFQVQFI